LALSQGWGVGKGTAFESPSPLSTGATQRQVVNGWSRLKTKSAKIRLQASRCHEFRSQTLDVF